MLCGDTTITREKNTVRTLSIILAAVVLGGCAVGRTASYADASLNLPGATVSSIAIAVGVQDQRPYVLSGNKPEKFVGLQRGGFGNPFDVNTTSGGPLATEVRDSLVKALKAKGYNAMPVALDKGDAGEAARRKLGEARAKRAALVVFREWKSDTMMNTDIHYDLTLTVLDERGNALATNTLKGSDNMGSLGMVSPEENITKAFARKLEQLFDDPKVTRALAG